MKGVTAATAAILLLLTSADTLAQEAGGTRRAAVDTVVAYQDFFHDEGSWKANIVFDTYATAELAPRLQVTVRPKAWRVRGDWEVLLDQASVTYEFTRGANWRLEAGRFPSPLGLGMMENRPDINAGLVWYHRPYYVPMPAIAAGLPRLSLMSAVYPQGVQAAASADRWDARAAFVDQAPVMFWSSSGNRRQARANVIAGGGVTLRQGLRLGAGVAAGTVPRPGDDGRDLPYRAVNVEGEFAFGYTRLSGEWTRDAFDTPVGRAVASGWTLQAQHTVTPRVFIHGRASSVDAPVAAAGGFDARRFVSVDTTVGYRATPDFTLRAGHAAVRFFGSSTTSHQIGLSVIWARRWW